MEERLRNDTSWWRNTNPADGTSTSISSCNNFSETTGKNGKEKWQLQPINIAQIVWLWNCSKMAMEKSAAAASVSKNSIRTWYCLCRALF